MLFGTDPRNPDTDGDGLSDFFETFGETNPVSPDSDSDGIPDGISPGLYAASPVWAAPDADADVVVTLASDLPGDAYAILVVNGLPVLLKEAGSLRFACPDGGMLQFRLNVRSLYGPVPLSLSVPASRGARPCRLVDPDGIFSGRCARQGEGRVSFPVLRLEAETPGAHGGCIHGAGDCQADYVVSVLPEDWPDAAPFAEVDGFERRGDGRLRLAPVADLFGRSGEAVGRVRLSQPWLEKGSLECEARVHRGDFWPQGCSCGLPHDAGEECPGSEGFDSAGPGGAYVGARPFLRIGDTNAFYDARQYEACRCCGCHGVHAWRAQLVAASDCLEILGGGGAPPGPDGGALVAVAKAASARLGSAYVRYRILDETNGVVGVRVRRYTVGDVGLLPDYNGDGVCDDADAACAAVAPVPGGTWVVPHRAEPWRIDFRAEAPEGAVLPVRMSPPGGAALLKAENAESNLCGSGVFELPNRNGTTALWLKTSPTNACFDLSFAFHDPLRGEDCLVESCQVAVRGMRLPERWTVPAGGGVPYCYDSLAGGVGWTLFDSGGNPVQAGEGRMFAVNPAPLGVGDYVVTARDPDLALEGLRPCVATGALHVVRTRVSPVGATGVVGMAAPSSPKRVFVSLSDDSTQTADWTLSPVVDGGARLHESENGAPKSSVRGARGVWVSFGDVPGSYSVRAGHPDCPQSADVSRIDVVQARIVPDYDFDGVIDEDDAEEARTNRAFRVWLNDDDDDRSGSAGEGDAGDETPGQIPLYADWGDTKVNGSRDLLDWFPLWLDIADLLDAFPPGDGFEYSFAQRDDALSFVWTSLAPSGAGSFQRGEPACAGGSFSHPVTNAAVARMSGGRLAIPADFLARAAGGGGVCLAEGRFATSAPLALEVARGGETLCRVEIPLRATPVEDMFRFVNLRPALGGSAAPQTRTNAPPNRPYVHNGKSVFLVHGFRVGADESRGWGAEFFKKLLRSGSRADFWMVTWRGDQGTAADYYLNVENAFATASSLAEVVNGVAGEKVVMAHSLGNMVVSSAFADHAMAAGKYFALNAAVASEAFDGTLANETSMAGNPLLHDNWIGFTNAAWSACWHKFFSSGDDRWRLTWQGRFADVPMRTQMYNFWSSGDEVLEISTNGTPYFIETLWDGVSHLIGFGNADVRRNTWQKQELYKGRDVIYGTGWAGWGFESNVTAAAANAASLNVLRANPIFEHDPGGMFTNSIPQTLQNRILAKGIPALSEPLGVQALLINTTMTTLHNVDMNDDTQVPRLLWGRNSSTYQTRWLHSDIQNMAYFFTHNLFDLFTAKGDL